MTPTLALYLRYFGSPHALDHGGIKGIEKMGDIEKKPQPMEAQFAAILADAAVRYADSPGKGATLLDFLNPPMKSVDDLKKQLDLQNDKFAQFRARRQNIFSAISAALTPVEVIGGIIAGAAKDVFQPAEGIYGAVLYLVNAARDVSSMYDSILELFDQLKDFTARLNVYVKHEMTLELRDKLVSILAALFEVLVISVQSARRGRFKSYLLRLVGSESPAQPALEKLKALTLGEERQVLAEAYGGVAQLNVKTDRVESIVTQMSQNIQEMRLGQQQVMGFSHRDKLKEILEPTPYAEDYYTGFSRYRLQGTGEWILEDDGWKSWIGGETRHLWMCGGPGTGKSFLTTRAIAWGIENLSQIAYFFFRDNDPETRSVLQALRDVAYQLSESDAYYAEQLMRQLHSSDDIKTIASAFRRLFVQPFSDDQRGKSVYIFLDGIDEAEQEGIEQLLFLLAPVDGSPLKLQFALVGRSYLSETISSALDPNARGQVLTTIYVTPDRSAADVNAFIADGVRNSRILSRSTNEFKNQVIEAMTKQADGLFILAKFMLTEINSKRHPSSILKSLESFPKEINGMLNKTLANLSATISEEEARDLNEMLQWVSCAEESLTLEQLEAALILKFGDPPLRLEEALRGQFSCFFELEREDGLTTDDLVKDFTKKVRERNGTRAVSPGGRISSSDSSSPARGTSPAGQGGSTSRHSSPAVGQLSPNRQFSPARSPGILDSLNDMDFRSNPTNTYVTFFHTSLRQFFRDGGSATAPSSEGVAIGFDSVTARVHILKTCLRIFNDREWFKSHKLGHGEEAMKQYAAWYWQEHLAVLDPTTVSSSDKKELSMLIFRMLTVESIILDWSVMYEKNNEGLEVLTDSNIEGLRKWLSDPEVLASLTPEARDFVTQSTGKALGIFEPLGRCYARAWLSEDCRDYIPTLFCFKISQNFALMDSGTAWSKARTHWLEIPVEERVLKAIAWANYPETAHWHLRLGSTYLMLGIHSNALAHYNKALELDHNSVQTAGRVAYCLSKYGRYNESLQQALKCAEIEEKSLKEGALQGFAIKSSKWRLYKDYLLIAQCSYLTGKADQALEYFRKAIKSATEVDLSPKEYFEAETGYFEILADENLHQETMNLLQEMSLQIIGNRNGQSRLIDFLLDQYTKPLVLDWIPKAASKTGKVDFFLDQLELAIEAANTMRDLMGVLYLRLAFGTTCAYNRDVEGGIVIFEQISLVEYRPRGNVPTRHGRAISFQKLAILYKQKILQADLKSPEAKEWIEKLERVQEKQSKHENLDMPANMFGSDVNVASIYLGLFYRLLGRDADATRLLGQLVIKSLDILLDNEPRNDEYALENLVRAFIAADDIPNAQALAQSMRKINSKAAIGTPAESPVHARVEPKLPDIQTVNRSCAQCLDNISSEEDFAMCRFCLDSYCMKCLEGTIKQAGNKTSDKRSDVVCRSDHQWFTVPPLNRLLHAGEILWGDGQVKGFREWENALRLKWRDSIP